MTACPSWLEIRALCIQLLSSNNQQFKEDEKNKNKNKNKDEDEDKNTRTTEDEDEDEDEDENKHNNLPNELHRKTPID